MKSKKKYKNKRKSKPYTDTLAMLVSASFALPGLSAKANDEGYQAENFSLSFYTVDYDESDHRMDVDVEHITAQGPIGSAYEFKIDYLRDRTSGASPVLNMVDSKGKPQQILEAGASIKDQRNVIEGEFGYYGEDYNSTIKLGYSKEDDYRSRYISSSLSLPFNEDNTTLNLAVAYSKDDVWNTYEADVFFNSPTEYRKRKKIDFSIGFEQLINQVSFFSASLNTMHSSGYLSDPYKKVQVRNAGIFSFPTDGLENFLNSEFAKNNFFGQLASNFLIDNNIVDIDGALDFINQSGISLALNNFIEQSNFLTVQSLLELNGVYFDSRPDDRDQVALNIGYSRFIERAGAGLHIDYRFAYDDWGSDSHTVDVKWKQALGDDWILTPSFRYYTQQSADFYDVVFQDLPDDGYLSSDYRLASFGSLSSKLELSKKFNEQVSAQIHFEYYDRRYQWALDQDKGDELDDYHFKLWALNVRYDF